MDPKATLQRIEEAFADDYPTEIVGAIDDLFNWMDRGGFMPEPTPEQWTALLSMAHAHARLQAHDPEPMNARLIAAAPELFEFAIQVLYSLGGGCRPDHDAAPYTREELIEMASDLVQRVDS